MHRIDRLFSLVRRLRAARVLLGMGCLLVVTVSFRLANSEQAPSGISTLKARLSDYEATLIMRPYNPSIDMGIWHGADFTRPKQVVKYLEVRFKQKRIPLGRGVYCDLAEVNKIYFRKRGQTILLIIAGSDAGASYRAFLAFKGEELTQRRVEDGEFPENFYEETRFVRIPVKD